MITINKFNKISINEIWNAENIYHLKTDLTRISKLIYHYEIYKKILGIPGDIVELGVFKGNSIVRFATYRSILENNNSRKIIGFDKNNRTVTLSIKAKEETEEKEVLPAPVLAQTWDL